MTDKKSLSKEEIDEKVASAQGSFDLNARLLEDDLPEDQVTVYTNRRLGVELRKLAEQEIMIMRAERPEVKDDSGNVIVEAIPIDQKALTALELRRQEIQKELDANALTFRFRGLYPGVQQAKEAEAVVKFKRDGAIPVEAAKEFNKFLYALLLAESVYAVYDHRSGTVVLNSLDVNAAVNMSRNLPGDQWNKLTAAFDGVQADSIISYESTNTPDF